MAVTLRRAQAWTVRSTIIYVWSSSNSFKQRWPRNQGPPGSSARCQHAGQVNNGWSNIHPGLHGPLVLSFPVACDVLLNVEEMLRVGESNVKEDCIADVIDVFDSLGVKAELSQSKS